MGLAYSSQPTVSSYAAPDVMLMDSLFALVERRLGGEGLQQASAAGA